MLSSRRAGKCATSTGTSAIRRPPGFAGGYLRTVGAMIAGQMTESKTLEAYLDLDTEDIHESLQNAVEAVRERGLPLAMP